MWDSRKVRELESKLAALTLDVEKLRVVVAALPTQDDLKVLSRSLKGWSSKTGQPLRDDSPVATVDDKPQPVPSPLWR